MSLENIMPGIIVCLAALIVASINDIKHREVPDWLSFGLMLFSLGYAIFLSILHSNEWFLFNSLIGGFIGFAIGMLMFYTGQWGGGDSKLIIGLFGIIGFGIPGTSSVERTWDLAVFMINTLLAGAVYGLIYAIWISLSNFSKFKQQAILKLSEKRIKYAKVPLLSILILAIVNQYFRPGMDSIIILGLSICTIIILYLSIMLSCVEAINMIKQIKVSKLTEGDWIIKPVYIGRKLILNTTKTGVSIDDIKLLKKHKINEVTIKEGIPFVPSFLMAFIALLIFGNWIVAFI